jgi:DNA-binding SARP family transcriptional activator
MLNDGAGVLATSAGVDLVAELIADLPASRTLAIVSRIPHPPALAQLFRHERTVVISAEDLAYSRDQTKVIAGEAGLRDEVAGAIHGVTRGWPMATDLLSRLVRTEGVTNIAEAGELPFEALLPFVVHRTVAKLEGAVRDALVVSGVLRGATQADLIRVLGDVADDWLFAQLVSLPFIDIDGERAVVHAEVANVVRERFRSLASALYERTLHVLSGDGAYVEAASVAIDHGDVSRAAAILDAAPSYTAARVPLGAYESVLDRLERDVVTRYPNVWLATIPYRAFAVDRATYVREAETVYFCLPRTAAPELRATVLIHLASAYTNVGRHSESTTLIEGALSSFAREPGNARATLLTLSATLRGMEGRFVLARALADEAAAIDAPDPVFGDNQTLQYIDGHEAALRGQRERLLVIFDELVRRLSSEELPLYLGYAAINGALLAWVYGDDARFQRYLGILEDRLTPGLERGFAPVIDAARGRVPRIDGSYPWPVLAAIAHFFQATQATDQSTARAAARAAVQAADERRDPFIQVFAHTTLFVLDESAREAETAALRAIVAPVESPELADAVEALIQGRPAGILATFIQQRLLRDRTEQPPRLVVELISGRVTKDGQPIRLTDKEFELMALLASSRGVLTRDRIGDALWSHIDPEEWPNNIKVTLSRLRSKLGVRDAVVSVGGAGFRLAPTTDVDLRQIEVIVRRRQSEKLDDMGREVLRAALHSFASGAAGRYERFTWTQPVLARIHDAASSAGISLAYDAIDAERFDDALVHAAAVAEIDPLNEEACELAIRARIARGEQDAARREYRRYAMVLANELDATPSARLAALARASA